MNALRHAKETSDSAIQLVLMSQDIRDRSLAAIQPTHAELVAVLNLARKVSTHAAQTVAALSRVGHVAANDTEGGNVD